MRDFSERFCASQTMRSQPPSACVHARCTKNILFRYLQSHGTYFMVTKTRTARLRGPPTVSTRAPAARVWGVNTLVSEEVNKPTLDEDGYLPENTERGHRRCVISAGAPPLSDNRDSTKEC